MTSSAKFLTTEKKFTGLIWLNSVSLKTHYITDKKESPWVAVILTLLRIHFFSSMKNNLDVINISVNSTLYRYIDDL